MTHSRLLPLAAAAALFLGFSSPAAAETKVLQKIGHWTIKAADGFCDASGLFQDGTLLEFTINAKRALMVSVVNPKWSIPEGRYQVEMQVDRSDLETFEAKANKTSVIWVIPTNEQSFNLLSHGRTLRARIEQTIVSYDLTYSESVVKALGQCAAPMMASANPFAGSPPAATSKTPPASTETPSNPFRRL
jgi:hypothetical protein